MDSASILESILFEFQEGNANQRACSLILEHGHIDGGHHKQWVLDQVLRTLTGRAYSDLIELYEDTDHKWDTGIAP